VQQQQYNQLHSSTVFDVGAHCRHLEVCACEKVFCCSRKGICVPCCLPQHMHLLYRRYTGVWDST
jgi:hypothetical protein